MKNKGINILLWVYQVSVGLGLWSNKYFIAILSGDVKLHNFQKSEVSDLKWCTKGNCIHLIRPYNLERIEVLGKIDKIINSYILVR